MDKYPYLIRVFVKIILILFYLSSACSASDYLNSQAINSKNNFTNCVVFYDDFLLQRLFGLSENQLELHSQKFECNAEQMYSLLNANNILEVNRYSRSDIKAKVIIDNNIYFIDSSGYVRNVERYSKINVNEFMHIMHTYQVKTTNKQAVFD